MLELYDVWNAVKETTVGATFTCVNVLLKKAKYK